MTSLSALAGADRRVEVLRMEQDQALVIQSAKGSRFLWLFGIGIWTRKLCFRTAFSFLLVELHGSEAVRWNECRRLLELGIM